MPALIPSKVRSLLERRRVEQRLRQDLHHARTLDISGIRTLCLALGPYRSHASVTASIVAAHPNGRAINHGGRLVLGDPRLDLIAHPGQQTTDRFLRYGLHIALGRAGELPAQAPPVQTFLWSDPQRTSRHLRRHNPNLEQLLAREPRLRFLMTVRHPMACALSNQRLGTGHYFGLDRDAPLEGYLEGILREIHWFLSRQQEHPERFFLLHAEDFGPAVANRLAEFLQVEAVEPWRSDAGKRYPLQDEVLFTRPRLEHYRTTVTRLFESFPEARERLLCYTDTP